MNRNLPTHTLRIIYISKILSDIKNMYRKEQKMNATMNIPEKLAL
jgi:hypothetical protein